MTIDFDLAGYDLDLEFSRSNMGLVVSGINCLPQNEKQIYQLSYDLDLGFSRSNFENAISQEWEDRLTWNQRDVSR